jgi:hypothetical protein
VLWTIRNFRQLQLCAYLHRTPSGKASRSHGLQPRSAIGRRDGSLQPTSTPLHVLLGLARKSIESSREIGHRLSGVAGPARRCSSHPSHLLFRHTEAEPFSLTAHRLSALSGPQWSATRSGSPPGPSNSMWPCRGLQMCSSGAPCNWPLMHPLPCFSGRPDPDGASRSCVHRGLPPGLSRAHRLLASSRPNFPVSERRRPVSLFPDASATCQPANRASARGSGSL